MKTSQIAIQYYTLRDFTNSVEDFAETCRKVAAIGYQAVQISGVDYEVVPPQKIKEICAENGLTICATHESSDLVLDNPEKVVENLAALGTNATAYPFPRDIDFGSDESVADLIRKLDHSGKVLADAGMVLTYHNHHHEFRKLNGQIILERIYHETDPKHLQGEIDTYWVQFGGGNPAAWCRSLKNRLPLLHLKDYRVNDQTEVEFSEIGKGNLNFREIIDAAEESGCEWFIVEQDSCPGDPFDSIKMSFDYLKSLAVD
ncbi:MAG: sugar phosphate isomerase/epimerase family protein [Puniceicoccales bacterium]